MKILMTADPIGGFGWILKAAEAGDPNGMGNVAVAYREGKGVVADKATARLWSEKAAAAGIVAEQQWLRSNPPE